MNILIIEDDLVCRDLIRLHLTKFKDVFFTLEIHEAGTLAEARALYNQIEPDMVILDGQLPDSDFNETLKEIPHFSANAAVIVLTNQEKMEGVAQAFKLGAVDYLTKQILTQGKEFVKVLNNAQSNYERKIIQRTGAYPTLRVKQVTEELVAAAEKAMSPQELKSLIEFSNFAKGNIEAVQKKVDRIYQTIFEGNGSPSMKADIADLKEKIDQIKEKLDKSLETEAIKIAERWKFFGSIGVGVIGLITIIINFMIKYAETIFKLPH